ncbi:ribosomal biogenesis protein LAS1L-like [Glandiceps talaboti]
MAASYGGSVRSGEIRVVGWINRTEWEYVYKSLYGNDVNLKKRALERIATWKSRFVSKMPIAIDCTASLVNAVVQDELNTIDVHNLRSIYSMALIRFVNMITDKAQTRQYAKPVHIVAEQVGLPEWLVNLRHEATHTELPSLQVLRTGVQYTLAWLQMEYWEENTENRETAMDDEEEFDDDIRNVVIAYQQEQYQILEDQKSSSAKEEEKKRKKSVKTIKEVLLSKKRESLVKALLQDGFLVPTPDQMKSLKITLEDFQSSSNLPSVPSNLLNFWEPVVQLFHQLNYIPLLVHSLLIELCRCSDQDAFATKCLAGWISCLLTAVMKTGSKSRESDSSDEMYNMKWTDLVNLCIENPSHFTLGFLPMIVSHVQPAISETTQKEIAELSRTFLNSDGKLAEAKTGTIYSVDNVLHEVKKNSNKQDHDVRHEETCTKQPRVDLKKKITAWQICTDPIDWSQYPIGMVPDQPLEDPEYLDLSTCFETEGGSRRERQEIYTQLDLDEDYSGDMDAEDVAMTTSVGTASWTDNEIVTLKDSISVF